MLGLGSGVKKDGEVKVEPEEEVLDEKKIIMDFKNHHKIDPKRFHKLLMDRDPNLDNPPKDRKEELIRAMGFHKASIKDAEAKKKKSYLYDKDGKQYSLWKTHYSEFSSLSPGIALYFMFLKSAAICFLLMSMLMAPAMYSNSIGNYLNSNEKMSNLDITTLANQQGVRDQNADPKDLNTWRAKLIIYADIAYSFVFALWIIVFN